jgi:hypothetical protein
LAVAGMHRSGTSMVTRILSECGVYIGEPEELVPATPANPAGHFEHVEFLRINKAVLTRLGGSWKAPPQRVAWRALGWRLGSLRTEAAGLVRRMEAREPWAWKDPRTSLTLRFWLPLIPDLFVVVCVRDPVSVARSLQARDGLSRDAALKVWHGFYRELARTAPPDRTLVTRYEAYFEDAEREIHRLVHRLKLPTPDSGIESAAATLRPDLWRQQPLPKEPIPAVIRRSHAKLLELARI